MLIINIRLSKTRNYNESVATAEWTGLLQLGIQLPASAMVQQVSLA